MKKNVLLVAGLCVLSTSAFASKARVEALGQDGVKGSLYINDTRSIFRNAAHVNTYKNYVVTEWGTAKETDSETAPRAEGGVFREMGTFAYGLYLGNNQGSALQANRNKDTDSTVATDNYSFLGQDNGLDLFFGGDMGLQWGARLHYAKSKNEKTNLAYTGTTPTTFGSAKNSALGISLGVIQGDIEAYFNTDLSDKSTGTFKNASTSTAPVLSSDEWKLKPSFNVGGSYKMNGFTFFGDYSNYKVEANIAGAKSTIKGNTVTVGAGRIHDVNPTARVFTNASVVLSKAEEVTGANTEKETAESLPVVVGFETDATSWLTLRASITQNVILGSTKTEETGTATVKASSANSTDIAGGATLVFGKLKVDGVIGTTGAARNSTSKAEEGVLATDNLMTRVGVTYNF